MAVAVNDIIDKVEILLQDTTNVRWTAAELLAYLNDGVTEIVREKPEASVTTAAVQLSQGSKQSLPTGGILLIDVTRNMGTDGSTEGNSIRIIDRKLMDAHLPDWHTARYQRSYTDHFMFDDRNPKVYYVYPPSDGNGYVEISYSKNVTKATAGTNLGIADEFEPVVVDYILYRAYSKDSDYTPNAERAMQHLQAFLYGIGSQEKAENIFSPTKTLDPYVKPIRQTTKKVTADETT